MSYFIFLFLFPAVQPYCSKTQCLNNGTCYDHGSYGLRCLCPDGYAGDVCELKRKKRLLGSRWDLVTGDAKWRCRLQKVSRYTIYIISSGLSLVVHIKIKRRRSAKKNTNNIYLLLHIQLCLRLSAELLSWRRRPSSVLQLSVNSGFSELLHGSMQDLNFTMIL